MLKQEIGSTFSDLWYRIADTRPRLSPHAHVVRQHAGATISYILEEPASGSYYRLAQPAYFFLGLLDGSRTVAQAWDACNAQLLDDAPTQKECVDLLAKLQLFGLLLGDLPLAPDMVRQRHADARKRRRDQRTGKWIYFSFPIFNPEPLLQRFQSWCRLIFSLPAFIFWLVLVLIALTQVFLNARELAGDLNLVALLNPTNLIYLTITFLLLRSLHELGHAAATKAFGGRVTEIGLIMVGLVLPIPYCDTSTSWKFPSTRHRVIVALGGVYFESFVAAIAAILWATTDPGLLKTLAYNTMILSGITTFIFNLNPLLRYDGYYILCDLLASPNIAPRSKDLWAALIQRHLFGVHAIRPPILRDRTEAAVLFVFGILSTPYRLFILLAIVMVILQRYPHLGVVLAAGVITVSFIAPTLGAIAWLLTSPALLGRRLRALVTCSLLLAAITLFLALVPMPSAVYANAVVVPVADTMVRNNEPGFVDQILLPTGSTVSRDQPVLLLRSPETHAELAITRARFSRAKIELDKAAAKSPSDRMVAQQDADRLLAQLSRVQERVDALTVRSPADGVLLTAAPDRPDLLNESGRFLPRGTAIAAVISSDNIIIRAVLDDDDAAHLFKQLPMLLRLSGDATGSPAADAPESAPDTLSSPSASPTRTKDHPRISVRVRGHAAHEIDAEILKLTPAATRDAPYHQLTNPSGGNVQLDPADPSGRRTLNPFFYVELRASALPSTTQPGARARVRFQLPPEPLLTQWSRSIRQYFKSRLG